MECQKSTPVNYFWYRQTLNITADIETSGSLQWWVVVCLATAWCIIFICFIKGIDSMGKVRGCGGERAASRPLSKSTILFTRCLTEK